MQMEMVVVKRYCTENDGDGNREEKEVVLFGEDGLILRERASTREDVLRRNDVHEKTKEFDGKELVVLVASVPFRRVE